jgi:predicted transcriptional regulator
MAEESQTDAVELAAELTAAWLSNSNTRTAPEDVPAFMRSIHSTIVELRDSGSGRRLASPVAETFAAAVTARKSLANPAHIISMIDGKPYKTLTRHLSTNGLTPAQYRERYGLKPDYPMTAPAYSEQRRQMAKRIGLGRKPAQKTTAKTK